MTIDDDNSGPLVVLPDHVMMREVGEEAVLLDFTSESYFGLDPVGLSMLGLAREHSTVDAVIGALVLEWDADADTLRSDLRRFLRELEEQGLVELSQRFEESV